MKLEFDALTIRFDDTTVIDRLTFFGRDEHARHHRPSGGGKSTLLRLIGGLLAPSSGEIRLNGMPIPKSPADLLATDAASALSSSRRAFSRTSRRAKTLRSRSPSFMAGRRKKPSVELTNCSSASDFPSTQINARRALWRTAAARRHCTCSRSEAETPPSRRTHECTRPRIHGRSA